MSVERISAEAAPWLNSGRPRTALNIALRTLLRTARIKLIWVELILIQVELILIQILRDTPARKIDESNDHNSQFGYICYNKFDRG